MSNVLPLCRCSTWARIDGRPTNHHPECPNFKVKRYAKVTLHGGRSYVNPIEDLGIVCNEMVEAEIGQKWTVELIALTEEEYDALPEFEGH